MNLVAILGFTSWAASTNRANHTDDRFGQYALTSDRVSDVVIATPYRSAPVVLARKVAGERTPPFPPRPAGVTGAATLFEPRRLRREDPVDRKGALHAAERYSARLGRHLARRGIDDAHVIVYNPFLAGLAPFEWAKSVTYYSIDDYATGEGHKRWRDVLQYSYDEVRRKAIPLVAVAPIILRRIESPGRQLVLANGVDDAVWGVEHALPDWMRDLPRPIAVYTGIVDDRLDPRAVRQIAGAIPGGTVLIVGPVVIDGLEDELADTPNVRFVGHKPHDEIPAIVSNGDLSLLPHRVSEVTRGMSPLKLFEALGAGLPVVATDLEPVRDLSDRIVRVAPDGDFGAATTEALALGRASTDATRAFVGANSWTARFDQLLDFAAAG